MKHNGEAIEFSVPSEITLAHIEYSVIRNLVARKKELAEWEDVIEVMRKNPHRAMDLECIRCRDECQKTVEHLLTSLYWLRRFSRACLSISTNLSKTVTKRTDE